MSVLAPLFLAGLAALAIPILIHLRQREEKKVVEFPSLMFLQDIPFHSERRKSIKHPLLLALRLLALLLVVAAFARPFLAGDADGVAGATGPRELVVLVDRSWSMTYEDRWNEARAAARDAVASQGPRDRTTLILFDEGATAPVRSSPSADPILRELDGAEPGDRATRYAPALRLAGSVLETSELPRREVVLVSDYQAAGWSGAEDVALGSGVTFTPVPVRSPGDAWSNASVTDVNLRRSTAGARDAVLPTARIILRGAGEGGGVTNAVLEVDGQVRERVEAGLQGGVVEVEFGAVALDDEPQRAVVRIENDGLSRDDARYFVLSPGREVSVLVVEPPSPRNNMSLYLRRALELSRDPSIRLEISNTGIPSNPEDRYDVIVLNGVPPSAGALTAFLEGGGGVFWAPGTSGSASEELSVLGAQVGEVRDHDRGGDVRLGTVDREHPVFQPFREAGTGNFTTARFFRTRRLEAVDSARVLARFADGSPALVEGRLGRGRVLTWAGTLDTYWSNLPVQPVFLPFVHRSILHLAGRDTEDVASRTVGSVLTAPGGEAGDEGEAAPSEAPWTAVLTPSEERIELEGRDLPLVLEESGFYELLEGDAETGRPVAVNVDPGEGDLTPRDTAEIAAAVSAAPPTSTPEGDGEERASADLRAEDVERHQGLWRYLLVGALLLLVGETVLSNRMSERRA